MAQPRNVPQGTDSQAYGQLVVLAAPGGQLVIGQATIGVAEVLLRAFSYKRRSIVIQNKGAGNVAIGPTGVTTANAPTLTSGQSMTLDKGAGAAIYAVADAGATDVRFIEENND